MDRLDHLSERELNGFYRGELTASESRRVVSHLLSGCPSCRRRSTGRWQTEVAERADEKPSGDRFNQIFDRAARSALRLGAAIESERKAAAALVAELMRHPLERQKLLIANSHRFRGYGLAEALLEAAFESGFNDPRLAIGQAQMALVIAEELPDADYGERIANDLRARAWGTLGNAQRIASRLLDAERSIQRGLELCGRGTGDPSERARLLSFVASLRTAQLRFDQALAAHDESQRLYESIGDRHLVGRTEAQKASVLQRRGEPEKAIEHYQRALQDLDPARDARMALMAQQNLAGSLFECGRLDEASVRCASLRRHWDELGNELDVVRCDWLEAKILLRRGSQRQAERLLREVRDRFVAMEIPYDAALANLDLAEALFDQGKLAEMGRRLAEAIPLFRNLGIHREAIAALAFLEQATAVERVTARLIRATARFVEQSRRDPDLRFRARALTDLA